MEKVINGFIKRCKKCGDFIIVKSNTTLYCDVCRSGNIRKSNKVLWRKCGCKLIDYNKEYGDYGDWVLKQENLINSKEYQDLKKWAKALKGKNGNRINKGSN